VRDRGIDGIAVHTGARIAAAARPQEVLASGTDWRLFAVTSTCASRGGSV